MAARAAGRDPADICLLAVSKSWPIEIVREAVQAGQTKFGENYLQEAVEKITGLADLNVDWHFIGRVQANKARAVARSFSWVHSIDRLDVAERLSKARGAGLVPLQVCVQVNVSDEPRKGGVSPSETPPLAEAVSRLPHLRLRGLMALPEATDDMSQVRLRYREVSDLREALAASGLPMDTLSMGMSQDLEAAIAEGATIVRVGAAIFGRREESAL
jgi:hypothetical protein